MTDTTTRRTMPVSAGAGDGRRDEGGDRATILRLGRFFVLAVGVALVSAMASTLFGLVSSLLAGVLPTG